MSKKLTKNPYSQSGIDHIFPVSGAWRDSSNGGERFRRILFGFAVVGDLHVGRIFGGWRTRRAHSRRRQRQRRDVRGRQADAERTSLEEISWPPGGQSKTWSRRCRWQDPGLRSKDPQKCVRDDPQRLQLVQLAHPFQTLKNGPSPASYFVYFRSFQTQILQKNCVAFSGIRTHIIRGEGESADYLTITTTAPS